MGMRVKQAKMMHADFVSRVSDVTSILCFHKVLCTVFLHRAVTVRELVLNYNMATDATVMLDSQEWIVKVS